MRHSFPLFQSHLDLAHHYWSKVVEIGDIVIDATCGNGYDTLKLCQLTLSFDKGKVYAIDIQSQAIESTTKCLMTHLPVELTQRVIFVQGCHSTFPDAIHFESIKLIVYNLGYLPKGSKAQTTQAMTTLESLNQAQKLIMSGGVISVTCYPGHEEGLKEQEMLLDYVSSFSPKEWSCCHHQWVNRKNAPSLLLIQKAENQLLIKSNDSLITK